MFWRTIWFERLAPLAFALVTLCVLLFWRTEIISHFGPSKWQPSNLYGAVFNWASIQSGFVFGIYGFIATKRDGFVGEILERASFQELLGYARRAYMTGFGLTFVSLPIMVVSPSLASPSNATYWIISAWFASFIWTFCAFLRVAFIFGMIVAVPDRPSRIVG